MGFELFAIIQLMRNKNFINLFIFYSSFLWFSSFSQSVLPTHYFQQGLNFQDLILGRLILYISTLIFLLLITSLASKPAWRLALIFSFLNIMLSIKILNIQQFYLLSSFAGISNYFFYVVYNIAHFENSPKERTGISSALMFSIISIVGLLAPALSGYIKSINATALWFLSGFFFVVSFSLIWLQKDFRLEYKVKDSLNELKATRLFIIIEGIWESLPFVVIPIYTLFFIKTPLNYGFFISYLSLVGIIANLLLGRLTDRLQKRSVFLYPITILMIVVTFLFPFATKNLILWLIITGGLIFLLPIFWNVSTAFVVDTHQNLLLAIPGREILLTLGRFVGSLLVLVSFFVEKTPFYLFFILGAIFILYPLSLYWRVNIKKTYRYL